MKSNSEKMLLNKDNMKDCFEGMVDKLQKRAVKEVPKEFNEQFRGIAEHMSVDTNCFSCNATSLAIIRQIPIMKSEKKTDIFSLELHALRSDIFTDVDVALGYGVKQEIIDMLKDRDALVEKLIEEFHRLDESLSQM